jgi:hypothetical protein
MTKIARGMDPRIQIRFRIHPKMSWIRNTVFSRLTADELDRLEGSENDLEQRRVLDQVVVTRDLPVTMRTIQVNSQLILFL